MAVLLVISSYMTKKKNLGFPLYKVSKLIVCPLIVAKNNYLSFLKNAASILIPKVVN